MIRINLLRDLSGVKTKKKANSGKVALFVIAAIVVVSGTFFGYRYISAPKQLEKEETSVIRLPKKIVPKLEKNETPFDVVEDIVDDIHGGRFKVRDLARLSSPSHLSPSERKLFERLFVRNIFLVLNTAIKPNMGFNTITLDADGAFFIFGVTPDEASAMAFQKEIVASNTVASADELSFERRLGESRRYFALKGFLNYNFIEKAYTDDSWTIEENYKNARDQVLYDIMKLAEARGVKFKNRPEWVKSEDFTVVKRSLVRVQIEATYPALMRWITDAAETGVQMGFTKINLTSIGQGKIISVAEIWVYSKN